MRRLLACLVLVVLATIPTSGFSDGLCPGHPNATIPYAHETLSVGGTAVPFTAATYNAGNQSPAASGLTSVITIRDSGGAADCTVTVTSGSIQSTTCSHT